VITEGRNLSYQNSDVHERSFVCLYVSCTSENSQLENQKVAAVEGRSEPEL